jgi:hypothetical protein
VADEAFPRHGVASARTLAEAGAHGQQRQRQAVAQAGQIESGQARSVTDLAEQEGVTDASVCRLLPLTCLARDIVEAILDGRQPKGLRLAEMLGNGPLAWEEQRVNCGFRSSAPTRGEGS